MRKTQKSALFTEFDALPLQTFLGNSICHVIDGGLLLHRVIWQRDAHFQDVCTSYVTNLCEKYGKNCVVVFDGYPDGGFTSSTKIAERHRRAKGGRAIDTIFNESTKFSNTSQKLFLANERNKKNFFEMLKKRLQQEGFTVKQS